MWLSTGHSSGQDLAYTVKRQGGAVGEPPPEMGLRRHRLSSWLDIAGAALIRTLKAIESLKGSTDKLLQPLI